MTSGCALVGLGLALASAEPGAVQTIRDEALHFSIEVPSSFQAKPELNDEHTLYTFTDGTLVLSIQRLHGSIGRDHLDPKNFPPNTAASTPRRWGEFTLDVTETRMSGVLVYAVQIPLRREAIQLNVGGPEASRPAIEKLLEVSLLSVAGESNWLTNAERGERLVEGIKRLLTTLLVVAVLVGWIVSRVRRKKGPK